MWKSEWLWYRVWMRASLINAASQNSSSRNQKQRKKEKTAFFVCVFVFLSFLFFFFCRRLLRLLRSLNNCFDYRITWTQCIPTCLTRKVWLSTGKNQGNTTLRPPKVCVRNFLRRGGKRMSIYRKNSSSSTRRGNHRTETVANWNWVMFERKVFDGCIRGTEWYVNEAYHFVVGVLGAELSDVWTINLCILMVCERRIRDGRIRGRSG